MFKVKINEDFTEFFDQIKILMSENKYEEAKMHFWNLYQQIQRNDGD